jgi:hypothetical protein
MGYHMKEDERPICKIPYEERRPYGYTTPGAESCKGYSPKKPRTKGDSAGGMLYYLSIFALPMVCFPIFKLFYILTSFFFIFSFLF